jgi:hypothetical protein
MNVATSARSQALLGTRLCMRRSASGYGSTEGR